jgi:hypothetical protein
MAAGDGRCDRLALVDPRFAAADIAEQDGLDRRAAPIAARRVPMTPKWSNGAVVESRPWRLIDGHDPA